MALVLNGEELADDERCHEGDRHRQFHGHTACANVLPRFMEDRPATEDRADQADHADASERLPDTKPQSLLRDRDERDPYEFSPLDLLGPS